jgi:hypothetical protein
MIEVRKHRSLEPIFLVDHLVQIIHDLCNLRFGILKFKRFVIFNQITYESPFGLLVQIGYSNSCCEHRIFGMLGGHGGCCLCGQVVQLNSGDSKVQSTDDFEHDFRLEQNQLMN